MKLPPAAQKHSRFLQTHRHNIVITLITVALAASVLNSMRKNPNFQWNVVWDYLFAPEILSGINVTLTLTVLSLLYGFVIGTIVSFMNVYGNVAARAIANIYLWIFRGTPQLVQLLFWYNLAVLYPTYGLHIPFTQHYILQGSVNDLITPFSAAILGLSLNEGAYMAEIMRSGISSIDLGQIEAARSLGMTKSQVIRRIVFPQSLAIIMPPMGNQAISVLKTTSLVSVISMSDLLYSAQNIYSRNFQTIPLLIVVCIWYLALTSIVGVLQSLMEKFIAKRI
ncbi:amino acid ABC transporter permease [Komagataeibacter xylinus]|uniref:Glutamate/aspartate import permease protein GltK n=1 Tax=Komagataeibacter xylinus TaxID=28448 RepID=A0A857FQ16_KOMXY|nr:amino acid ABC transporter permease [Komagataeibacter xylinus]QHC35599.1 amino acid ABC transporter permease [Komagataeibacter xylinus]